MNDMMLMALTDPAGAPAHPLIFLVLGVVTFALHLTAVNVMLGTLGLAAWGAFSKNPYWQRLAGALGTTAKVAVSVAIVLGVAPLLFVQVIYDPFWYTSNVISAWWLLGFLAILTVAYLALYRFYGLNHRYEADGRPVHLEGAPKGGVWLAGSLVLMLVCGLIMHAVVNQSLLPAEWMNWYAPNGEIEPYGRSLHSVTPARLLFFLLLSLPVTAGWLFGMRRYLLSSGETDYGYVDFIEGLAHGMARVGSVLVLLAGAAWMATLPETMSWFAGSVWMWIGLVPLAYFGAMSFIQKKRVLCIFCNYMAFGMTLVMTIVLVARSAPLRDVPRGFGLRRARLQDHHGLAEHRDLLHDLPRRRRPQPDVPSLARLEERPDRRRLPALRRALARGRRRHRLARPLGRRLLRDRHRRRQRLRSH